MSDPLKTTFDLLASSSNPHALEALLPSLDATSGPLRDLAAEALLKRSHVRGHWEVIRRLERVSAGVLESIRKNAGRLQGSVKQALLRGDPELRLTAVQLVRRIQAFEHVPVLLELLADPQSDLHEPAAATLGELVHRIHELCGQERGESADGKHVRHARQARHSVLSALESACGKLEALAHPREVIEAVLILGDIDDAAVKKLLAHPSAATRELATLLLKTSKHPGVMQLIVDAMSRQIPHPKAFEAVQQRDDPEFVTHLLRWFPERLTPHQARNFRQVENVAWLDPRGSGLEMIPPGLQRALVAFVAASGVSQERKLAVQEWLVKFGGADGRAAAAEMLAAIDSRAAQRLVFEGLESDDPEVQAWATSQLRAKRIPEAYALLIERLDSPLEAVREAAREELGGFNLERLLGLLEHLDPETCLRAGRLIQKIHPDCVRDLAREMSAPIRSKRIRAARAAKAMQLHKQVIPSLLAMLEDNDASVRRAGAEVLAGVNQEVCQEALRRLLEDSSPRVREAAQRALEQTWPVLPALEPAGAAAGL